MIGGLTFAHFHEQTPDLTGNQRMQVFYELPRSSQWAAWNNLAQQAAANSQRSFEEME